MSHEFQQHLMVTIDPLLQKIQQHPVFSAIHSVADLCRFAEVHVFAVWDFMCLLRALRCQLIGDDILWLPPRDYLGCRLLHEIFMEEESDQILDGNYISHFDWYLAAMEQCGADTKPIKTLLENIRLRLPLRKTFAMPAIHTPAAEFVETTFHLMAQSVHVTASAFAYGRECITEKMFLPLLTQLNCQRAHAGLDLFVAYFQRHIYLDRGKHSQQAQMLVARLCGDNTRKWQEAARAAVVALKSRLQLLDSAYDYLETTRDCHD